MSWLTKSRFLSGLQCHKRLWFEIHQPLEEKVEPGTAMLQGRAFDEVVQRLRPGVVISREEGMSAAIAETERLLSRGATAPEVLYQPAFRSGDLAVLADVLRRIPSGFELMEIKATTAVKERHIPDVAFQALVLKQAGVPVQRVIIGHVNNRFVLTRAGRYDGILTEADVTDDVMAHLPTAAEEAAGHQRIMRQASPPPKDVGDHCSTPYECPFLARCHIDLPERPEYHVDLLPRGGKVAGELLADGYEDLRRVPASRLTSVLHLRVLDATVTGTPFFDLAATMELRELTPPFSYLDFETINLAVPEVIGTHPYEQVSFQWSVHVERPAQDLEHAEYLAIKSFGDFGVMARELIAAIPAEGPVFAYNAGFERGVLERIAALVPEYAAALNAIAERLFDLLPVARSAYYHRDMQGSWSIKSVMPTIDPSLDYKLMGEVQGGGAAQSAFLELRDSAIAPQRVAELRAALLQYCKHDTWVMVSLRRFLCGEALGLGQMKKQVAA